MHSLSVIKTYTCGRIVYYEDKESPLEQQGQEKQAFQQCLVDMKILVYVGLMANIFIAGKASRLTVAFYSFGRQYSLPKSLKYFQSTTKSCANDRRGLIKEHPAFYLPVEHYERTTAHKASPTDSVTTEDDPESPNVPYNDIPKTTVTLKDIPPRMRHLLVYKGHKLPVQVVIGKKGVDTGVLNSLHLHFRRHDVVRVKLSKKWKENAATVAQELEDKSGAVIVFRGGLKVLIFRGYTKNEIPSKERNKEKGWWDEFPVEEQSTRTGDELS